MTAALKAALAARCPAPEWSLFFEVGDQTGFGRSRAADAVAMNTWPSRGLEIHGFEFKSDRGDWLRELKQPAKSAAIQRYCDRWWVAVTDASIIKADELPPTWGSLILRGKKLVQAVEAPRLSPEPVSRGFVASLLREAGRGMVPTALVDQRVEERLQQRVDQEMRHKGMLAEQFERAHKRITEAVAAFEKASGIRIDHWNAGDVGKAVAFVLDGGLDRQRQEMARIRESALRVAAVLAPEAAHEERGAA